MEMASETRAAKVRTPAQHWISDGTKRRIAESSEGNPCLECGLILSDGVKGERCLRVQVRQHWTRYYCPCDILSQHQRDQQRSSRHGGIEEWVDEIDADHNGAFCEQFGLPSWPMAASRPYLKGSGKLSLIKRGLPLSSSESKGERRPRSPDRPLSCPRTRSDLRDEEELSNSDGDEGPPPTRTSMSQGYGILSGYDAPPPLEPDFEVVEELEDTILTLDDVADQEMKEIEKDADQNWTGEVESSLAGTVVPPPSPVMPELEKIDVGEPELTKLMVKVPRVNAAGRSVTEV